MNTTTHRFVSVHRAKLRTSIDEDLVELNPPDTDHAWVLVGADKKTVMWACEKKPQVVPADLGALMSVAIAATKVAARVHAGDLIGDLPAALAALRPELTVAIDAVNGARRSQEQRAGDAVTGGPRGGRL